MPLYEYRCKACGHTFEKIQSFSAPDEKDCPMCKGEVERLISAPAVHFSGSGFYSTDYASKSSAAARSADSGATDGAPDKGSKDSSSASSADGAAKSETKPNSSTPATAASSPPTSSSSSGKE